MLVVIIVATAFAMMIFLDRLVNKTKLGRSIRAVAEDAPTAALMGIDIDRTISRTFIIGGALAGVAGFMFGAAFGVSNTMGFFPGVKAFAAAVLGGIGNIRGAMLGGLLLGEVEVLVSNVCRSSASSGPTSSASWCWCSCSSSDRPASSASGWGVRHEQLHRHRARSSAWARASSAASCSA